MADIKSIEDLVAQIAPLLRRRHALLRERGEIRRPLPDWAALPLRLVGFSWEEIDAEGIEARQGAPVEVEGDPGAELGLVERRVDELECGLLRTPPGSLSSVKAELDLLPHYLPGSDETAFDAHDSRMLRHLLAKIGDDLECLTASAEAFAGHRSQLPREPDEPLRLRVANANRR